MSELRFFASTRRLTVAEAAAIAGATLADAAHAGVEIAIIAAAEIGGRDAVVYIEGKRNAALFDHLQAAAVFCTADLAHLAPPSMAVMITPHPRQAFARIGRLLYPQAASPPAATGETGVSAAAFIDPAARIEDGAVIEAGAAIGPGAAIGAGTIVGPNAVVGAGCQIGRDCYIGPGSVVQFALIGNRVVIHAGAKIGQDGFGFVPGRDGPERIPQIGRVIVQDNVEIGANSTVDRGALSDTVIGENCKIDNLVQIAHNVRLGRNCIVAGMTGISGSVTVGDNVMIAGGVGIADHLTIGDGARLAARSGFMHDVPAGEIWAGYPAKPMGRAMREFAALARLGRPTFRKGNDDG